MSGGEWRGCNECFEVLPENLNYFYAQTNRRAKFKGKCRACTQERYKKRPHRKAISETKTPKNIDDAKELAIQLGLQFIGNEFTNNKSKYDFKCSCGEVFNSTYTSVRQGRVCPECTKKSVVSKLSNGIEWVRKIFKDGGNELLETEYKGARHKYRYICDCGNEHSITPYSYRDGTRCRQCGLDKMRGENNPMWNPELTEEDRNGSRNYPEYIEWRNKVRENFGYMCYLCGHNGSGLVAHHIEPYSIAKHLRTEESNGILLCSECHSDIHNSFALDNLNFESFKKYEEYHYPEYEKEVAYDPEVGFYYDIV